jgi:hypothetical protein
MSSSPATNENVNLLLTKIMTDKFCKRESSDWDACIQNFVVQRSDGSFVDQSIQRKGLLKCEPYKDAATSCLQDERRQQAILRQAGKAPGCRDERAALAKCQRLNPGNSGVCEAQVLEMVMCGLVHMVQSKRSKTGSE